jgi:hypothetical protein
MRGASYLRAGYLSLSEMYTLQRDYILAMAQSTMLYWLCWISSFRHSVFNDAIMLMYLIAAQQRLELQGNDAPCFLERRSKGSM